MDLVNARTALYGGKRVAVLPSGQIILLCLLFGVGVTVILSTIEQAALNTVILLGFVSVTGLALCRKTQIHLNDVNLKVLGYFWLIKLCLTLFLLYAGWIPLLDPQTSTKWGYDPQRYYVQAKDLIDIGWRPTFVNLKYGGVLYYYAIIYYLIGFNPVIPALINSFVTLIAALYLIKMGYEVKRRRSPHDWTIAFALLLPEMVWYDVMTSRETLMAALLIFSLLTVGRYLIRSSRITLTFVLTIVGSSMLIMAAVRTSMLLAVFLAFILMILLVRSRRRQWNPMGVWLMSAVVIAALVGSSLIASRLGGYNFSFDTAIQAATEGKYNIASQLSDKYWGARSIGELLIPNGPLQSLLFVVPRMILYLIAPLPKIDMSITGMMAGDWQDWQSLFTLLGSIVNIIAIPYVLASLIQAFYSRKTNPGPLMLHIAYWATFASIAGGNFILQERYRVMAVMLLYLCAWLGVNCCSKRLVIQTSIAWYGLLVAGATFYISYKVLLA